MPDFKTSRVIDYLSNINIFKMELSTLNTGYSDDSPVPTYIQRGVSQIISEFDPESGDSMEKTLQSWNELELNDEQKKGLALVSGIMASIEYIKKSDAIPSDLL